MNLPKTEELFDLSHTRAAALLSQTTYAFECLPKIKDFILSLIPTLDDSFEKVSDGVYIAKDAKISPLATIEAPTVIGHNTEVRPGAFIRGSALIGDDCVIGNSTEIKNAIIFDHVQIPHYNYVGDSILGYCSHMGAGAVASNFRLDHGNISVHVGTEKLDTGLRKMGVLLGDRAEVGCNSVLCPGSVVGREAIVYPLSRVRGLVPERTILDGTGKPKARRM